MLLRETPEGTEPAGLAAMVALHAVRLGQVGVAISRVGQDEPGTELLRGLDEAGVDTSHVQTDPDLPTGRVIVRAVGGTVARYLESRAAFDKLQWDYDLEDMAQQADAVIYGLLTRRDGQSRSEENRFLRACTGALKVFDLTNRADDDVDRGHARSGLELADAAVIDRVAGDALHIAGPNEPFVDGLSRFMRDLDLSLVIVRGSDDGTEHLGVLDGQQSNLVELSGDPQSRIAALVALAYGVVRGRDLERCADFARRVAEYTVRQPQSPIPADWLQL